MSELASLIELIGQETTLTLIEAHGGTRLSVPRAATPQHRLGADLGAEGFAILVRFTGGSEIKVPMARRWRAKIYRARGMTFRDMARRLGCTETAVYGYFQKAPTLQPSLPL